MPSKRSRKTPNQNDAPDAITLLTADHRAVKAMFKDYESLKADGSDEEKAQLVGKICSSLTVHMTIEEEIFYPAVREAIDDEELMDEAEVEHASAKDLIAQLEADGESGHFGDHYDAKVKVLAEMIEHHVDEEESEMFRQAKKAIDSALVGAELEERRAELTDDPTPDSAEAMPAPSAPEPPRARPVLR
jgi:hemerythrin-like domain-containing protein